MPPAGTPPAGGFFGPLGPGIASSVLGADLHHMTRGVQLLLLHCAVVEERPSARARLGAALGEALATRLVGALTQRRGGRRASSWPYNLT
jgi:hypothetical protein